MKSDINAENDKMQRAGISAVYRNKKMKKIKGEFLKDADTKKRTMDFIFGKSDDNPLKEINEFNSCQTE